ncbi:MAG TPA: DUF4397 domain-containing protein [Promineifilum sp.]|nr:DUF4397 domain-containing protein [Promineifilum sp.]
MSNRSILRCLFIVAVLAVSVAAAQAEPNAPAAVRVRVAHLAPFDGSDAASIAVHVDGAAVGGTMAYGGHSAYITLPGAAGDHLIEVLRDGAVVLAEPHALADGDTSIVVIGDDSQVPLDLLVLDENLAEPGVGRAGLRITHVAAIGATIDDTKVDICSQTGELFNATAAGLRYTRTTSYRLLPVGDYDLKITRLNAGGSCLGPVVIDPPVLTLAEGTKTTLFLVGDGTNQTLAVFTFADGLIGDDNPPATGGTLFLPVLAASS